MSETFLFVVVAVVALSSFVYLAARRGRGLPAAGAQASEMIRTLDIEAFRNLVDPDEEEYLRSNLSPPRFRTVKRERAKAALAYVKVLSAASLEVARLGGAAQRNPDPEIAASGRLIASSATTLRLRTLQARANLTVAAAFPGVSLRPLNALVDQYDRVALLASSHAGAMRRQAS